MRSHSQRTNRRGRGFKTIQTRDTHTHKSHHTHHHEDRNTCLAKLAHPLNIHISQHTMTKAAQHLLMNMTNDHYFTIPTSDKKFTILINICDVTMNP